jgi:hypothetical protein
MHDGVNIHLAMVQMPALNTPQFNWARNKMSRRPQPLPPIFQPEVAAEAIVFAAHSRRNEIWVGRSTVQAIIANKIAPRLLDRLLASKGYTSQLTDEPADPNQQDNLFAPVPGDPGTHGRFDQRAASRSLELWATEHKGSLALASGLVIGVGSWFLLGGLRKAKELLAS